MMNIVDIQCQSNQIFYAFFQLISLTLNLCLCVDLILTIYDPFSPAHRRTKFYYGFSLATSVSLVLIIYGIDTNANKKTEDIPFDCIVNTPPGRFS
jgi:hypothetical protein